MKPYLSEPTPLSIMRERHRLLVEALMRNASWSPRMQDDAIEGETVLLMWRGCVGEARVALAADAKVGPRMRARWKAQFKPQKRRKERR